MAFFYSLRKISLPLVALSLAACPKAPEPAAPQSTPPPAPTPTPVPKVTSAEPTRFDEIARNLDAGGDLYLILSTEAMAKKFTAALNELKTLYLSKIEEGKRAEASKQWDWVVALLGKSGVGDISGIGFSSLAVEPGNYQYKAILHHPEGKGTGPFWKTMDGPTNALEIIPWLPENTAVVHSMNLSLQPLWQLLNQEIPAEYKKELDSLRDTVSKVNLDLDRVIAGVGPFYGFVVTLDEKQPVQLNNEMPVIPTPGLTLFVQVTDPEIRARIEQQLASVPGNETTGENGLKIKSLAVPIPVPFLKPAIAWQNDVFILSSSEDLIREMAEIKAGKKPGLAANAEFQKIAAQLPKTALQFSASSPSYMKVMAELEKVQNRAALSLLSPAARQRWFYSTVEKTTNGALTVGRSPIGISDLGVLVPANLLVSLPDARQQNEATAQPQEEPAPTTEEAPKQEEAAPKKAEKPSVGKIKRD